MRRSGADDGPARGLLRDVALTRAALPHAAVHGPITQGRFLRQLGIELRCRQLLHQATVEQAEEIARAGPGLTALRRTMATAGRTVLFSALTIAASIASLIVFPQNFLHSMGIGGALVALIAKEGAYA